MRTAVVYWSQTGNTQALAEAIAAAADARLFTAGEFTPDQAAAYDAIAFGCPAMGAEVLEEDEFQPMWDAVKGSLAGKKIGLFGSWGWGEGEWMNNWVADAAGVGITLVADPVICQDAPGADALAAAAALGRALK